MVMMVGLVGFMEMVMMVGLVGFMEMVMMVGLVGFDLFRVRASRCHLSGQQVSINASQIARIFSNGTFMSLISAFIMNPPSGEFNNSTAL